LVRWFVPLILIFLVKYKSELQWCLALMFSSIRANFTPRALRS